MPEPADPARVAAEPPGPTALSYIREDVARLWSTDGLAYMLAVTAPLLLKVAGGGFGLIGLAVHYAALAGTYFMILAWVAEGRPGLPQGASENLGANLWRGVMVTFVGVVPPVLTNIYLDMHGVGGGWLWAATLAGAVVGASLVPAASIAVYASNSGLAAAAPHLWYAIIKEIPKPYASMALACVTSVVAVMVLQVVVIMVFGRLPAVAMLVYSIVACGITFAVASIFGGVIHRTGLVERP